MDDGRGVVKSPFGLRLDIFATGNISDPSGLYISRSTCVSKLPTYTFSAFEGRRRLRLGLCMREMKICDQLPTSTIYSNFDPIPIPYSMIIEYSTE